MNVSSLPFARLALAVLALTALGQQLLIQIAASHSVLNFFSYFTNLSNIFAATILLLSVLSHKSKSHDLFRYVSTVNMAVVGLVFAVLLRNTDLGALLPWVNVVLHYVMPVAIVLDWLVDPPASNLSSKQVLLALVIPSVYLVYVIIRGGSSGWYPYPFLNPANVGGKGIVTAYCLAIAATFFLVSWCMLSIANRSVSVKAPAASQ
jgi:hypothetical protein